MSPSTNTNPEYHDRLQRLEEGYTEVSAQLAANTVGLDALGDKVTSAFTSLDHQLQAVHLKLDSIGATLGQHEVKIAAFEASRKDRKGLVYSVASGVVVGLVLLVAKYLVGN